MRFLKSLFLSGALSLTGLAQERDKSEDDPEIRKFAELRTRILDTINRDRIFEGEPYRIGALFGYFVDKNGDEAYDLLNEPASTPALAVHKSFAVPEKGILYGRVPAWHYAGGKINIRIVERLSGVDITDRVSIVEDKVVKASFRKPYVDVMKFDVDKFKDSFYRKGLDGSLSDMKLRGKKSFRFEGYKLGIDYRTGMLTNTLQNIGFFYVDFGNEKEIVKN